MTFERNAILRQWPRVVFVLGILLPALAGCGGKGGPTPISSNPESPHWISQSQPPAKVAVVFVHGLFGTTDGTWTNGNGIRFFDLLKSAPGVGDKIDTFAFGFTSTMLQSGSLDVRQAANWLEESLVNKKVWDYDTVVFVGHSMGGLVVMQELINHPDRLPQAPLAVFFATPQEGSQIAALGKALMNNPALAQMVPADGSDYLKGLDDAWSHVKGKKTEIRCAYETAPLYGLPIVSQFSATRFCSGARIAIGGTDHISIVKPDSPEHPSVVVLVNAVREVVGRERGIEMPDFVEEGDALTYNWKDPTSQARVKLVNSGSLPVRFTLGHPSSDKLMLTPSDTPRQIDPGQVTELGFDLLWRGDWKKEYEFTLGTSVAPTRTVIVRVADPEGQKTQAARVQAGVASAISSYVALPENQQALSAMNQDARDRKIVEIAERAIREQAPSAVDAANSVRAADVLSTMGWPTLASQALRNAESRAPALRQSPSFRGLNQAISTQSFKGAVPDGTSGKPAPDSPDEARITPPPQSNAAVLSKLSVELKSVPALQHYGEALKDAASVQQRHVAETVVTPVSPVVDHKQQETKSGRSR